MLNLTLHNKTTNKNSSGLFLFIIMQLIWSTTFFTPLPIRNTYSINQMSNWFLTIVSSQKSIPILVLELAIYIFFRLFDSNVHVAIQTSQNSCGHITGVNVCLQKTYTNTFLQQHYLCNRRQSSAWRPPVSQWSVSRSHSGSAFVDSLRVTVLYLKF